MLILLHFSSTINLLKDDNVVEQKRELHVLLLFHSGAVINLLKDGTVIEQKTGLHVMLLTY